MTPTSRWIIRIFALAGLGFSGAAAWVHYKLLTDPTYVSACDISSTFNCSQLYLSPYGSVRGVPVAVGGLIWFALVALLAWLGPARSVDTSGGKARETTVVDAIGGYLFVLATIGLASILYLAYASYKMQTVCLLCVGTYVCVVGIFVTTGLSGTGRIVRLPVRLLEDLRQMTAKPGALITAILFLAGSTYAAAFFPAYVDGKQAAQTPPAALPADQQEGFRKAWEAQPRVDLGIKADGAKVVIVKFNDWLCPGCKAWHQAYQPTLDRYAKEMPGAIKYVVKDWNWNSRCNVAVLQTFGGHEGSCEAAAAVRMARDRGKVDEMIEWLFENQQRLIQLGFQSTSPSNGSSNAIKAQAVKMLGVTDFDREYAVKLLEIRRDEADGQALGVNSTPVYYINGVRTTDGKGENLPVQYLEMALKLELSKGGK